MNDEKIELKDITFETIGSDRLVITESKDDSLTNFIAAFLLVGLIFVFLGWTMISLGRTRTEVNKLTTQIKSLQEQNDSLKLELAELSTHVDDIQEEVNLNAGIIDQLYYDLEFTRGEVETFKVYLEQLKETGRIPSVLNKAIGVCWYDGHLETYYNLDMSVVVRYAQQRLAGYSDAEYWVRQDGCKMLGSYIMLSADYSAYPYGSIVETSLGTGIVVDTGVDSPLKIDVAVNW